MKKKKPLRHKGGGAKGLSEPLRIKVFFTATLREYDISGF